MNIDNDSKYDLINLSFINNDYAKKEGDVMNNEELLLNIDKIHTTRLGHERIVRNLKLKEIDAVEYLKNKILNKKCKIYKKGKNYYCQTDDIMITINSYNYCIITAHLIKSR